MLKVATIRKGTEATHESLTRVINFMALMYPDEPIKVSDTPYLDIPPDAIQILRSNGEEVIFAPDPNQEKEPN